ncbi:HlyD family secretion protein [Legionella busanensis]|uniref:HlyD family secretion protein n=1 Tax=Legionella busanensis TaxID=190655 RepID=A0A378JW14_9GAMM|nr:efflux RND transporter periplasmic adaptor subunit [Legionella busanensis]STX52402.1 HlyD family secretion protein [Legionella busanensis]
MNSSLTAIRILFIILITSLLISCGSDPAASAKKESAIVEVEVALPIKSKVVDWDEYTGRFQAIEEVDIRSRVNGYLTAIKFKDGQFVKKDDLLFIIDPRPFQYALARAQAQYTLAKSQYGRVVELYKKKFIAASVVDQRLQDLQISEAQLKNARVNLEYTEIRSPINGKISRYLVSVGNLVRANETVLTKIVSMDPIYFYFDISQGDLLKYNRLKQINKDAQEILIRLPDEKTYLHQGKMNFKDNVINESTGTMQARAIVPNPDKLIYPGLFGRAKLAASNEYEALLLPERAVNTDQSRHFVYTVNQKNEIQRVDVELGPLRENDFYVIRRGLKGNELVVINGIQRIQTPNQKVKPVVIKLIEKNNH